MTLDKKIKLAANILASVSGNTDITSFAIKNAIIEGQDVNRILKEVKEMAEDNRPVMNQILGTQTTNKLLNNL